MINKIVSSILVVGMVIMTSGFMNPYIVDAATVTTATATFGRLKASATSDSIIVKFATPTGIQSGGTDTISLTFSSQFVLAPEAAINFDFAMGNSANCSSASYLEEVVALTPSATDWGVDITGQVITFSPATSDTLTAGYCVRISMGTAAVTGGTGSASTVTNGGTDDNDTISIAGAFGDTGTITVDIVDDDQVSITATVNQTLTFDLDTAILAATETSTPYTVPLGVLSSGVVTRSDASSINMIVVEGGTNASGGMNVSVKNAFGSNGLVSTSVPADKIPSATGTMAAGTANYGLCVASSGILGFSRSSAYNTTCALGSQTNGVVGLTTTVADILTSTGPLAATAHAEIVVNAAISTVTPAHADYTDTLTFVATASF